MSINGKETIYSLHNADNFKKELSSSYSDVVMKLSTLLVEYLRFILENTTVKNAFYVKFVITRGLLTITHVFRDLLLHSKNLDLTYFHCQKSFYFYVEFVGQILEDEKTFLQLTTRDATIYVYKKTIYEISNEIRKKTHLVSISFNQLLQKLDIFIHIIFALIDKSMEQSIDKNKLEEHIKIISNLIESPFFLNLDLDGLKCVEKIVNKMASELKREDDFFDMCLILFKKIMKSSLNTQKLHEKIHSFNDECNEESLKQTLFSFIP
jgi:hypothetical protein